MSEMYVAGIVLALFGGWMCWQAGADLGRTRVHNDYLNNPKWEGTAVPWVIFALGVMLSTVGGVLVVSAP